MILLLVNYSSKVQELLKGLKGLSLETYVSVVGNSQVVLNENIKFIGNYKTPLEALSEALIFAPTEDIILHAFSNFPLYFNDIDQMEKLLSKGFDVVFSYFETNSKIYANFLYPLIGASLGRPVPPPMGPMMLSSEFFEENLEDLISGSEFYNSYQIHVFLEASTTFRPIAGIYFPRTVNVEEKGSYHAISSYIDFFPRWRVLEGEHPMEILNFPRIDCPRENVSMNLRTLLSYLEKIACNGILYEEIVKDFDEVYDLQKRECLRRNLLSHKSEIVEFITRMLKLII